MAKNKLVITLPDYQRLHRVIASVLDSVEANTPRACLFFAMAGAYLIEKVHRRPARPVSGAAFYRLNEQTGFTLGFGQLLDGDVLSAQDAFHCWIECDGTVIDLMAPIFHGCSVSAGRSERIPVRMFQRPLSSMSPSPYDMELEGDFFLHRNPELELELIRQFLAKPSNGDLVKVCEHWYRPNPKKMQPSMQMGSDDGSVRTIQLSPADVSGAW